MTKKLLDKTTANLLVFSIVILLIAAPAFYFLSHKLYIDETDETLILHKKEFDNSLQTGFKKEDIPLWNKYNRNIKIIPFRYKNEQQIFTKIYFDKLEDEQEPYREINAPVIIEGRYYTYQDRINLIESEDMMLSVALLFVIVIALLLGGILTINKFTSKRLWKPFYDTLDKIEEFEIDKNKQPVFLPTPFEEFERLNASLNRLVIKNVSIYKSQREFIENAAHELQTPLALFQTKIDTLFQMDNSKEQSLLLNNLNNDVARLNRLNKNLLLLSKIDSESYFEKQEVVLNEHIQKNLAFFTEQANAKNIRIVTAFKETVIINSNTTLIEIMISNLFLNAIRHNIPDGTITITISQNAIAFSNTGNPIAIDSNSVFDRFAKLNPSGLGNGLGLSLIKKIAELNHWKADYHFDNNLHIFSIRF